MLWLLPLSNRRPRENYSIIQGISLLEFKIGQIELDGKRAKKFEATRIHFLIDVFTAVAVLDGKAPY